LQQQKARLQKKIERETANPRRSARVSMQLLELCRERGRITVAEAAKAAGANRNTIKDHLEALARAGHIAQDAWYGVALSQARRCERCSRASGLRHFFPINDSCRESGLSVSLKFTGYSHSIISHRPNSVFRRHSRASNRTDTRTAEMDRWIA
jgi:hypothetical protein